MKSLPGVANPYGLSRRELLALLAAAPVLKASVSAPSLPVAIARCRAYDDGVTASMSAMFDQLGGLPRLVRNKTVTVKLNLTGGPDNRFQGRAPGLTHYVHPKVAFALAALLDRAGARRIRFVESCWASNGPLEDYLAEAGWNVRRLQSISKNIEFENTNALGKGKRYVRFKVPGGGLIYPAYDLNHSYHDTDFFVSLAKLKNHAICGVTLSMKNIFGITPASIYGNDAGIHEPNEHPRSSRAAACHNGRRQPSSNSPAEINPASSRDPGYRMPRVTAELTSTRPIDLAIIDGVESVAGGEGPWIGGLRAMHPGVLIAGTNPVNVDTVATAVMGYPPRVSKGRKPFVTCDNTLLLAESLGLGSADLKNIEVRGLPVAEALCPYA
ncbi:MAG TPA: DUF362 domain-containing protein [Bryobacteraceae bacterium]|nr:DUF362 domain-containing protein [Bryobacteraceae bacterium]